MQKIVAGVLVLVGLILIVYSLCKKDLKENYMMDGPVHQFQRIFDMGEEGNRALIAKEGPGIYLRNRMSDSEKQWRSVYAQTYGVNAPDWYNNVPIRSPFTHPPVNYAGPAQGYSYSLLSVPQPINDNDREDEVVALY